MEITAFLTRGTIGSLPASAELDALVNARVTRLPADMIAHELYCPSRDITAAMRLAEHMKAQGWTFRLISGRYGYSAWFEKYKPIHPPDIEMHDQMYNAEGDTAPLAIARAALMAALEVQ